MTWDITAPPLDSEQPGDVLKHEQPGTCPHSADRVGDIWPEPAFIGRSFLFPGGANRLAGESRAHNVDGLAVFPPNVSDVSQIEDAWHPVRNDS